MAFFGGSNRAARIAQIQASIDAQKERDKQDAISKKQDKLHAKEMKLAKKALAEQSSQNAAITEALAKQVEIAERPAPPPPPPAAVLVTGGTAAEVSADDSAIDIRRRGRGALRINMNAPQSGGGATGLNVPKG
jgi:hypothetical protein